MARRAGRGFRRRIMSTYELIGSRGCGSAIVEMALALANVPYTLTDLPI